MKTWHSIALGVFLGLLCAGLIILIATRPRGVPYTLVGTSTPSLITVHVDGAVISPGVYQLPRSSRLVDAIDVAGGLAKDGSTEKFNLATPLVDGIKIHIPRIGETLSPDITFGIINQTTGDSTPSSTTPININTATVEQLILLPGIGVTRAEEIIQYRQINGPFVVTEDLLMSPG